MGNVLSFIKKCLKCRFFKMNRVCWSRVLSYNNIKYCPNLKIFDLSLSKTTFVVW